MPDIRRQNRPKIKLCEEDTMFVFIRAVTYATLFIGFFLVYVPSQLLARLGVALPSSIGVQQLAGFVLAGFGGTVALWCVFTFARHGKGTPAPFDPPRLLVVSGPYRYVRNPMYIGAVTALLGAALYWSSTSLLAYAVIFLVCGHLFVVYWEEPVLSNTFGCQYEDYCHHVRRWLPRLPRLEHNADA